MIGAVSIEYDYEYLFFVKIDHGWLGELELRLPAALQVALNY